MKLPFGYDDNTQPTSLNATINAVGGSKTVLYNGYLVFPNFLDSSIQTYYPEVKEINRLMYNFFSFEQSVIENEWQDRIGASDKTVAAYFYKRVGTTLASYLSIPMEIKTPYWTSAVGSTELSLNSNITLKNGDRIVLWSDISISSSDDLSGTSYTCKIPTDQTAEWTFDSTGKTSVLTKEVTLASWTAASGFNDSDIPVSAEIPMPTKRLYKVSINVESSRNHVILDNADVKTGRLFYCIGDTWYTFNGAASASLELRYGTTIKLAKNHNSSMTGFTYNSDATSETKTIMANGTSYTVDVYSKTYTVNANNMNIPFYVTPNSYTITCNIGMGISSYNFSTTSKYATSLSKQSYSSNKSFTVYYKDTCSYNGVVKTGFESPTPYASGETVSTKTITFTARPMKFRVAVSTVGDITATFNRTSSPYAGAATGNLTSGYTASGAAVEVTTSNKALVFHNGYSFDAYYGDVISCDPKYSIRPIGEYSTYIENKYLSYTSSMTITEITTWRIDTKKITAKLRLTNSNFLGGDVNLDIWYKGASKRISLSAGSTSSQTIDAGTPVHVSAKQKNSQTCQLKVAEKAYSTSLTNSDFTKSISLSSSENFVRVVDDNTKSSDFNLTFAPALRYSFGGYGINVKVTECQEIQMNGTSEGSKYSMPYEQSHTGGYGGTSSETYIYCDFILLRPSSNRIYVKYNYFAQASNTFFSESPATKLTSTPPFIRRLNSNDSSCPSFSVITYGPYAKLFVIPYFYCSYPYWGSHRYYTYVGDGSYIRTNRKAYGKSGTPGIGYTSTGTGTIPGFSKSHLYYKGSSGKADKISAYLKSGSVVSLYDSINTSLSRPTFLSSSDGKNHSSDLSSDMKKATFYAIMDFNSTSNQILSDIKSAMKGTYRYIIDYVMDYSTENY